MASQAINQSIDATEWADMGGLSRWNEFTMNSTIAQLSKIVLEYEQHVQDRLTTEIAKSSRKLMNYMWKYYFATGTGVPFMVGGYVQKLTLRQLRLIMTMDLESLDDFVLDNWDEIMACRKT